MMTKITISTKIHVPIETVYDHMTNLGQLTAHLPIMRKRKDVVDQRRGPHPSWCIKNRTVAWNDVSRYYALGFCDEGVPVRIECTEYDLEQINESTTKVTQTVEYENRWAMYPFMVAPLMWLVLRGVLKNNLRAHTVALEDQLVSASSLSLQHA